MMTPRTAAILLLLALPAASQDAATWQQLNTDTAPSPRRNAAAVFDPVGRRVVLFGGRGAGGDLDDVWALDLEARRWTRWPTAPGPAPRFTHNAVYDASGRRMLVWSGRAVDAAGSRLFADVWALDLATHEWQRLAPVTEGPSPRYGTAAVFDPVAGELVTFAGFTTAGRFDDTWRFDPNAQAWRDVSGALRPGRRCLHGAALDPARRRMLIFGGQRGDASLDDAWSLDLARDTWTELPAAPQTGGRRFPAVAFDAVADRLLVFGGLRTDGTRAGDLWGLTSGGQDWQRLTAAGPPARDGAVLVALPGEPHGLVLFGGTGDDGHLDDTWLLPGLLPTAVTQAPAATPPMSRIEAWPNPFNTATTLAGSASAPSRLRLYDVLGRRVADLGVVGPGPWRRAWDGRDAAGRDLGSGVYLAALEGAGTPRVRRVLLLR